MEKYYVDPIGRIRVRGEEIWIQSGQKLTVALKVLDGFNHPNVLWWFSNPDSEKMRGVLKTSQPYRSVPEIMGISAICLPIRPNPTVLTAVEVLSIDYEADVIRIAYADASDGTPVLGIKPYTPSLDRVQDPAMSG